MHDVDRLIRAVRFREEYWKVVGCATEAEAVERKEATGLAVDHAGVGGSILEAWRICVVSKTSQMNRPRSPSFRIIPVRLRLEIPRKSTGMRAELEIAPL